MSTCHLCQHRDGHLKRQDGELVCVDRGACERRQERQLALPVGKR